MGAPGLRPGSNASSRSLLAAAEIVTVTAASSTPHRIATAATKTASASRASARLTPENESPPVTTYGIGDGANVGAPPVGRGDGRSVGRGGVGAGVGRGEGRSVGVRDGIGVGAKTGLVVGSPGGTVGDGDGCGVGERVGW